MSTLQASFDIFAPQLIQSAEPKSAPQEHACPQCGRLATNDAPAHLRCDSPAEATMCSAQTFTLNHAKFWLNELTNPDADPCCTSDGSLHGTKRQKPARDQFIEHFMTALAGAQQVWSTNLIAFYSALCDHMDTLGLDQAIVFANIHQQIINHKTPATLKLNCTCGYAPSSYLDLRAHLDALN